MFDILSFTKHRVDILFFVIRSIFELKLIFYSVRVFLFYINTFVRPVIEKYAILARI